MKEQKNLQVTFIILLVTFVLNFAFACQRQHEKIQLEIKEITDGNAANRGEVLFFRMYNNREVEFDLARTVEIPLSESNLIRKKMVLSEQDANEIQSILVEMENSDLKKSYPAPPSDAPISDAGYATQVLFASENGENKSIVIPLQRWRIIASAYEQRYPKPLVRLLKRVTDIRTSWSN